MSDDLELLRLAESVIDGTPVDWDAAVRTGDARMKARIERLRVLASIADASGMPADALAEVPSDSAHVRLESEATMRPGSGAAPASAETPASWGPLRILEKLGEGTSAEVFRAWEPRLQREVALKLQRPPAAAVLPAHHRFLEEAQRLARVRHPNVLVVHGVEERDGRVGLWTDLVRGQTLEELLAERGVLGPREAVLIGIDICCALAAVHAAGLVHRDVKTTNVLREEGGRIVLMDFGSVVERLPRTGETGEPLGGSPLYMAPELLNEGLATPASDVYALGVLLFRLVCGEYPFVAGTVQELSEKQLRGEMRRLRDLRPELPGPFVHCIERAMAPRPEDRFATAAAMEAQLTSLLPEPPAASSEPKNRSPRRSWTRPAIGILLALAAGASWLAWHHFFDFDVETALFRSAGTSAQQLTSGGRVQVGDRLFLEVRISRPAHLYVLDEDARGRAFALFPLPGLATRNPLPARARHRLPGPAGGSPSAWEIDTSGGRETILVVASREPLVEVEDALRSLGIPVVDDGKQTSPKRDAMTPVVRGLGRVVTPGPVPSDSTGMQALARLRKFLALHRGGKGGIWVKEIHLENP